MQPSICHMERTMTEPKSLFNLKAVVQQTGIKPDTLRAWERRYGLPMPERSSGGHRLYSRRDIRTLQWLTARQDEGLSIKRAVQLWRQIEAEGQDPLQVRARPATLPAPIAEAGGQAVAQLRRDWVAACLAFDEQRAERILAQAFALYPPEVVGTDLLQKGIADIGEGWYHGQVTVQQEHFASALAIRRLEALVMMSPSPTRRGRILAACPPEENHVFGLLLFSFLLRRQGWDVLYLGASVPTEQLVPTVIETQPQLVVSAAQRLHTAATLLSMAQLLRQEGLPLAYGGAIFNRLPSLRSRIPGHFLGEQLGLAPQVVEILMASPPPLPPGESAPPDCYQAREHYLARRGFIEALLAQDGSLRAIPPDHLRIANRELAQHIQAALTLGDMSWINAEINWLGGMMDDRHLPDESLRLYLQAYHRAAREYLAEPGGPILDWLGKHAT